MIAAVDVAAVLKTSDDHNGHSLNGVSWNLDSAIAIPRLSIASQRLANVAPARGHRTPDPKCYALRRFDGRATMKTQGRSLIRFLAGAALAAVALPCSAQAYPAKPILMLMPLQAGSAVDVMMRIVAP